MVEKGFEPIFFFVAINKIRRKAMIDMSTRKVVSSILYNIIKV